MSGLSGAVSASVGNITIVSPANGVTIAAHLPHLAWLSYGFNRFQVQFSTLSSFESDVVTLPEPVKRRTVP